VFDRLFQHPFVLARQRNGPLAEERRRYLTHCAEQQMSRRTLRSIARYTLLAAEFLRLAKRPNEVVSRAEVEAEVDRWLARRSRRATVQQTRLLGVDFTADFRSHLTCLSAPQLSGKLRRAEVSGRHGHPDGAGIITGTPRAHSDRLTTARRRCVVSGQPPSTADDGPACSNGPRPPPP
jgi:hypothetical protein